MAFGAVKGTLTGAAAAITNPFAATGSVSVAIGDLIVVAYGQRGTLTGGTVTDNLGHTYTAQNAGSDAGNSAGRAWWKIATAAGTLTSVSMTAAASTEDVALAAVVYEGAFDASPLDASPANTTTSGGAKIGPATGTLAQADELVVNWANGTVGWSSGTLTVGTIDVTAASGTTASTEAVSIASLIVSATTSTQATWTLGSSAALVFGVMTFKKAVGGPVTHTGSVTEAATTADAPAGSFTSSSSRTEAAIAADAPVAAAVRAASLTESVTAADAPAGVITSPLTESVTVAATESAAAILRPSLTEAVTAADAPDATVV